MARDLRELTAGTRCTPRTGQQLNGWLIANKTGGERIRAGLPKTWTIGDKTGTTSMYGGGNDIAVIWPEKGAAPIIMAIYTNRPRARHRQQGHRQDRHHPRPRARQALISSRGTKIVRLAPTGRLMAGTAFPP